MEWLVALRDRNERAIGRSPGFSPEPRFGVVNCRRMVRIVEQPVRSDVGLEGWRLIAIPVPGRTGGPSRS